jgi:hypothetical protein
MNKKRFAGLLPLLVIMAFAAVPAAAQAAPHWYKKNVLVGPGHVTVTSKGTLTLNALSATIVCKTTDAEEIWNPIGGGPGEDLVNGFTLTCKNKVASAACPKGAISVIAEGFGWPSRLVSSTTPPIVITDEIFKIRLNVGCAGTSGTIGDVFEGSLAPEVGSNALIFGPGSGSLKDLGGNPLTVSGKDALKAAPGKITATDP